jgi:hypothetical protein
MLTALREHASNRKTCPRRAVGMAPDPRREQLPVPPEPTDLSRTVRQTGSHAHPLARAVDDRAADGHARGLGSGRASAASLRGPLGRKGGSFRRLECGHPAGSLFRIEQRLSIPAWGCAFEALAAVVPTGATRRRASHRCPSANPIQPEHRARLPQILRFAHVSFLTGLCHGVYPYRSVAVLPHARQRAP